MGPRRSCALILACAVVQTGCASFGAAGPAVVERGEHSELRVPGAVARVLEREFPGFEFPTMGDYADGVRQLYPVTARQLPWAVIGDFDGDGSSDLVADGRSDEKYLRICVWDTQASPRIEVLFEHPVETPRFEGPRHSLNVLMYASPGRQRASWNDDRQFVLNDGFVTHVWEKAGSTFYWDGERFAEFDSAD